MSTYLGLTWESLQVCTVVLEREILRVAKVSDATTAVLSVLGFQKRRYGGMIYRL